MAKRIVVVSKSYDIIKNDIDRLITILSQEYNYIKKKKENKTFTKLDLSINKIGILWWVSEDFTRFIERIDFFKNLQIQYHVVEMDVDMKNHIMINYIEHGKILTEHLKLGSGQLYFKFKNVNKENEDKIKRFINNISENLKNVERIQIEFDKSISDYDKIDIASGLSSYAAKYDIRANSCCCPVLYNKEYIIGSEPCISAFVMEKLLKQKMLRRRNDLNIRPECMCHKHIDACGCGEFVTAQDKKQRKKDSETSETKRKDKQTLTKSKKDKFEHIELF